MIEKAEILVWDDEEEIQDYLIMSLKNILSKKIKANNLEVNPIKIDSKWKDLYQPKKGVQRAFVCDIFDDKSKEALGIDLLKYFQNLYPKTSSIVFSANTNYKDECINDLGIFEKNYIYKGDSILKESVETISERIVDHFESLPLDPNDDDGDNIKGEPANLSSKKNTPAPYSSPPQKGFLENLSPDKFIKKQINEGQNFDFKRIRIEDTNENYDDLPFFAKVFLCKGLFAPVKLNYNFLNLDNTYWKTFAEDCTDYCLRIPDYTEYPSITQVINKDSLTLESLIVSSEGKFNLKLFCDSFESINKLLGLYKDQKKEFNPFQNDITTLFIYKRIVDLIIPEDIEQIPEDILSFLREEREEEEDRLFNVGFIIPLIESLTKQTGDIRESSKIVKDLLQCPIWVDDIFYCQVLKHDDRGFALVRFASIENIDWSFEDYLPSEDLRDSEINNRMATFKYILYKKKDKNNLIERTQAFEPLPQEVYHQLPEM